MHFRPSTIRLALGSWLLFAAVLLCALLVPALSAPSAYADDPTAWPTVDIQMPFATTAPIETPVVVDTATRVVEPPTALPTVTPIPPQQALVVPTDVPPTLEPSATVTPYPTWTPFPTRTTVPTSTNTTIPTNTPSPTLTLTSTPSWLPPAASCYVKPGKAALILDVPYIHQVNDITGADGNWACGPTSVAMVLAYYSKLQPWQASGSIPAGADSGSAYAPYVTNVYTDNGHTYSALAGDPQGKMVAGLYGTICPTGLADWSKIKTVLEWHGLTSQNISVSFEAVKAALKRGHPVIIGNDLTSEGHILVAVGYTTNNQLIVNDPYGNRFSSGYGSNDGQDVYYAWSCMRAQTALEVIGTYIPPVTPTAIATITLTPQPTETFTATPTSTSTAISTYAVSPTEVAHKFDALPLIGSTDDSSGVSGSGKSHSSILGRADAMIASAVYAPSEAAASSAPVIAPKGAPNKVLGVCLLLLSIVTLVIGVYWLISAYKSPARTPKPSKPARVAPSAETALVTPSMPRTETQIVGKVLTSS